jgi:glycerophosphoryl diester phosphodiesterase
MRFGKALAALGVAAAAIWAWNSSWLAGPPADPLVRLIAHRGMHQTFSRDGLDNDTCTAERMLPPQHALLENTIASMRAAFEAGAYAVELDVHPTTDGKLAVFHDWTLDCRTEGTGRTRDHDMAHLKTLDIGHGYTADGGKTFPLRGKGVGQMPSLDEVLAAFPDGRFVVNFKSREAREGPMLAALVEANAQWRAAVWGSYGADPVVTAKAALPDLKAWTRDGLMDCLLGYLGYGWTGIVPAACHDSMVMVPVNYAWLLWGWPNRFIQRMRDAGTEVILVGPYTSGDPGTAGIDDGETLAEVPEGFSGYLWTNRIEIVGPLVKSAP